MFVPAYNRHYIDHALTTRADALILDVEDSVPDANKQQAREILADYFSRGVFHGRVVFIRINAVGTPHFDRDMDQLVFDDLCGYMPAKIRSADEIVLIDRRLSLQEQKQGLAPGKFALMPLIENAAAVTGIREIASASRRLIALCFGAEDYLDSMHGVYSRSAEGLAYPRSVIAAAARAEGLLPIDTPYLEIRDTDGFLQTEREMYRLGFAGCLLLTPKQIEPAHAVFSPSEEEIRHAENVIAAVEETMTRGTGIAVLDGLVVGPPLRKLAAKVLALRDRIQRVEAEKRPFPAEQGE